MTASVSVIIPTWNRAATLVAAIESALAQAVHVLEVLVCDDGSTDETRALVDLVARRDNRVRWMPGPRGGRPAIPRNRGIQASRGEWIAFLDSDDAWLPNKVAAQLEAAQRLGCHAACSNAIRVVAGRDVAPLLDWQRERLTVSDLLRVNWVVCSSAMARRSLVERAGGFPEAAEFKAVEDYAFWLRLATLTDFAYCAQPLVRYRDDPSASIRSEQELAPSAQRRAVLRDWNAWLRNADLGGATKIPALARALVARLMIAIGRA